MRHRFIAGLEADLLKKVRERRHVSRAELARELKLAPSTAGIYVDRLITEGFLSEGPKAERDVGRPPTLLSLDPDGGRFVGVDFAAGHIRAVAVDFSQNPIKQVYKVAKPTDNAEVILTKLEEAIAEAMAGDRRPILGVGVAVPGTIDPVSGVAGHYEYIPGWTNIPLSERLTKRFNAQVFLDNNIRLMGLAEMWFGKGRGVQNFICVGVRRGIGAGIIIDGQLYRGCNNLSGEIGGWPLPAHPLVNPAVTTLAQANKVERLEEVASVQALLRDIADAIKAGATSTAPLINGSVRLEDVIHALQDGDPLCSAAVRRCARTIGWAITHLNIAFNPQKFIIAGPVAELGDAFMVPLQETVQELSPELHTNIPEITFSTLGEYNGALGAAAWAVHLWAPHEH